MTNNDINKFHGILQGMVVELDQFTRRREGIAIERSADQIDQMKGARERELAVRALETRSVRLREARAALGRIQNGTYGICAECEEPISPKRLAALPTATLCIRCQQAEDCKCAAASVRPVMAMAA